MINESITQGILQSTQELRESVAAFRKGKLTATDLNAITASHSREAAKLNAMLKVAEYNNRHQDNADIPEIKVYTLDNPDSDETEKAA